LAITLNICRILKMAGGNRRFPRLSIPEQHWIEVRKKVGAPFRQAV
jgi:hypothetical protein